MRRSLGLLAAIACTACSRQLAAGYPSPAPAPAPRVVLAGAPTLGRSAVSETEALNYVLTRVLMVPVAGKTVPQLQDTFEDQPLPENWSIALEG